jgi:hypothetical protein
MRLFMMLVEVAVVDLIDLSDGKGGWDQPADGKGGWDVTDGGKAGW